MSEGLRIDSGGLPFAYREPIVPRTLVAYEQQKPLGVLGVTALNLTSYVN